MGHKQSGPIRLAIVSTPRSGNNWLQHLLSRAYDLPRLSPANLPNVRWDALPGECVLILHWRRDPTLLRLLAEHRFRVVSLARHPLDVLISILHFTLREMTDGWLQGEAGGERAILGMTPRSPAFVDYACGPRARALLDVSRDWWQAVDCVKVRYEDLVADPLSALRLVTGALGIEPRLPLEAAIAACTLTDLRGQFPERTHHFWQGQPGLWRRLLTVAEAERIASAQGDCFRALGYACDADAALTAADADEHWRTMLGVAADEDATLATLQNALFEVKRDLSQARIRLSELESLGPGALGLARSMKRWATRFPWLARWLKRWLG
jgi:Sulfotransferase domain